MESTALQLCDQLGYGCLGRAGDTQTAHILGARELADMLDLADFRATPASLPGQRDGRVARC
jgi:hypothetical protein